MAKLKRFYWIVPEDDRGRWGSYDRVSIKREAFRLARFILKDESPAWAAVYVYAGDLEGFRSDVDPLLTVRAAQV